MFSLQSSLIHVVQENLIILNTTKIEVSENRHALNGVIETIATIGAKLDNLTTS